MAHKSVPLSVIDEAFAKILIEELAHLDRIEDLGAETPQDLNDGSTRRGETIADFPGVSAARPSQMLSPGNSPAQVQAYSDLPPIPLDDPALPPEGPEAAAWARATGPSPATPEPQPELPAIDAESPQASDRPQHWELRIVYPDGRECTLPLEDKPITIGRSRDNGLWLQCEKISRHHARMALDRRGPRVDDLGSVNGIQVNGIKVPAAYLKARDVVRIGTVQIHLLAVD